MFLGQNMRGTTKPLVTSLVVTIVVKKCRTPKHMVDLYMMFAGDGPNNQEFEAHFTSLELETGTPGQVPDGTGPRNTTTSPTAEDKLLKVDDMIVDYSTNVFGDHI